MGEAREDVGHSVNLSRLALCVCIPQSTCDHMSLDLAMATILKGLCYVHCGCTTMLRALALLNDTSVLELNTAQPWISLSPISNTTLHHAFAHLCTPSPPSSPPIGLL
jgi:hypothetical protein